MRLTSIRAFAVLGALPLLAMGLLAPGCGGDSNGNPPPDGGTTDSGSGTTDSVSATDSTPSDDSSTDAASEAATEAGPTEAGGETGDGGGGKGISLQFVHAAPGAPASVRFCIGISAKATPDPAKPLTFIPGTNDGELPPTATGLPYGFGGGEVLSSTTASAVGAFTLVPVVFDISKEATGTGSCKTLIGSKNFSDLPAAGFFPLAPISGSSLKAGGSYIFAVTGCLPNLVGASPLPFPDLAHAQGACGADYTIAAGNAALNRLEPDTTTTVDAAKFGAQFVHLSAFAQAALTNGVVVSWATTTASGDAGTDAADGGGSTTTFVDIGHSKYTVNSAATPPVSAAIVPATTTVATVDPSNTKFAVSADDGTGARAGAPIVGLTLTQIVGLTYGPTPPAGAPTPAPGKSFVYFAIGNPGWTPTTSDPFPTPTNKGFKIIALPNTLLP